MARSDLVILSATHHAQLGQVDKKALFRECASSSAAKVEIIN